MVKLSSNSSLNRRDFLRIATALGGAAALASFLEGCSKAGISEGTLPSPTDTREISKLTTKMAPPTIPVPETIKPTETNIALPPPLPNR